MGIALPFTIESVNKEKLTFSKLTIRNGVEYLEGENEVQPNSGPPMHLHHKQDECLTVITGIMGYQLLGEEKKYAGPGESVLFKAGKAHKFWNAGTELLRCSAWITPADNVVYFLSEIFKSSNKNGGRPGMYDAAFLLNRYKSEFAMLDIPEFIQKLVFPAVLFFGNLVGKNKKFSDAPAPI